MNIRKTIGHGKAETMRHIIYILYKQFTNEINISLEASASFTDASSFIYHPAMTKKGKAMNTLERCNYERASQLFQDNDNGNIFMIVAENSLVVYITDTTKEDGKIWMVEKSIFDDRYTKIEIAIDIIETKNQKMIAI
jgi:CRISPR/Cas system CSM-associated protein Csm3 (group 7 of RAMP superfamily)